MLLPPTEVRPTGQISAAMMSMKKQRCDEVPTDFSFCKTRQTIANRSYQPVAKIGCLSEVNSPSAFISCADSLSRETRARTGLPSRALYNSKCRESKSCFLQQHRGYHALVSSCPLSSLYYSSFSNAVLKYYSIFLQLSPYLHHIKFHILRRTSKSKQLS